MRHTILSNSFSILLTLSFAGAAGVCGCNDHTIVDEQELADVGTKVAQDTNPTTPNKGADSTIDAGTKSGNAQTKVAPFAIGCNDSHDLMPAVNPKFTRTQIVPDANACVIALDPAAQLVAACASANPATVGVDAIQAGQYKEMFVQKRAANGSVIFNTPIAGLSPLDVVTTASGDSYVLGAMSAAKATDPAFGLVKITPTGAIAWNSKFYKLYDTTAAYGALAAASDGTVWVTGSTNFVAAQFDGSGNELQRIPFASGGNPGWGAAQAIRILGNGDILVAGIFNKTIDFGSGTLGDASDALASGFLARFTASGQYVTSQVFNQNSGVQSVGLAVGPDGAIVLSGNLNGIKSIFGCTFTSQMAPGFVAKLDDTLAVQWTTLIPAGVGHPEIDAQGNIVVPTKTPANVYLVRLDPTGNAGTAWWTLAGGAAGYRTALAPDGTIYVSGSFLNSVSFDETRQTSIDSDSAGFIVAIAP